MLVRLVTGFSFVEVISELMELGHFGGLDFRDIMGPLKMVSFPYYSHIFRDSYGSGMGP